MSFERVDNELPWQAYAKAIFSVQIGEVQFNLNGLPDHLFHISALVGRGCWCPEVECGSPF
jgi:hypothetical protein